jgi:hypothetical protein
MRRLGMKITADDIYNINRASLKDAVFLFGGGCTAEILSSRGLLLTNHHCGFSHLQALSSLENDYMKYGFVARRPEEELLCKGLSVTRIVRLEDVTAQVLKEVSASDDETTRARKVKENSLRVAAEAEKGTHYTADVLPLYYGNQYLLVIKETFYDVRLVLAPPQCIGEFGGDTDNWMWPRHNGDFMLFRVYAGPDNKPAEYSPGNKPYQPLKYLEVSTAGVREGDFAFVFGFPGFTQQYLPASAVAYIQNREDQARVQSRTAALEVLHAAMKSSDAVRIQYAAKEARISNAWKKWQGEMKGLERLQAVAAKQALEVRFRTTALRTGHPEYAAALDSLNALYARYTEPALARAMLQEFLWFGPDLPRFAWNFRKVVETTPESRRSEEWKKTLEGLKASTEGLFKNFNPEVERELLRAAAPICWRWLPPDYRPDESVFTLVSQAEQSLFFAKDKILNILNNCDDRAVATLREDPMYRLSSSLFSLLQNRVNPEYESLNQRVDIYMRQYVHGLMTLLPDARLYYPDANGTLRITYGRVMGYAPRDAVRYHFQTTHTGILEKYVPGDSEFDLLPDVKNLLEAGDFSPYQLPDGRLPVAFITNCHTTGGNSGSPVLDARGRFIGINFDRAWESTMSDIMYHPDLCRNIVCDARYILWVIERWAKARYLLEEMTIVR